MDALIKVSQITGDTSPLTSWKRCPLGPSGPAGPGEPVAPGAPVAPEGPAGPGGPAGPWGPVAPARLLAPSFPWASTTTAKPVPEAVGSYIPAMKVLKCVAGSPIRMIPASPS